MFSPRILVVALLGVMLLVAGCSRTADQPGATGTTPSTDGGPGPADLNGLGNLSDEDRQLAEAQKVCPVGGEPLGSMGTPVKIVVQGREILLCCAGCEDAIRDDPEKYLAVLDQQLNDIE